MRSQLPNAKAKLCRQKLKVPAQQQIHTPAAGVKHYATNGRTPLPASTTCTSCMRFLMLGSCPSATAGQTVQSLVQGSQAIDHGVTDHPNTAATMTPRGPQCNIQHSNASNSCRTNYLASVCEYVRRPCVLLTSITHGSNRTVIVDKPCPNTQEPSTAQHSPAHHITDQHSTDQLPTCADQHSNPSPCPTPMCRD